MSLSLPNQNQAGHPSCRRCRGRRALDRDGRGRWVAGSGLLYLFPFFPTKSQVFSLSISLSAGTAGRELGLDHERCAPPTETLATELMEYRWRRRTGSLVRIDSLSRGRRI
jgi:hypothetical protein